MVVVVGKLSVQENSIWQELSSAVINNLFALWTLFKCRKSDGTIMPAIGYLRVSPVFAATNVVLYLGPLGAILFSFLSEFLLPWFCCL